MFDAMVYNKHSRLLLLRNIFELFDRVKSDRSWGARSLRRCEPMEVQRDRFRSWPSARWPTFKGSVPRYEFCTMMYTFLV